MHGKLLLVSAGAYVFCAKNKMAHRISLNLENRFSLNLDLLLDAYDKNSFSNGKIARFKELNKQDLDGEEKSSTVEKEELTSVPYYKLFRCSTLFDKILLLLAVISSLASFAGFSMLFLIFGKATGFIVTYVYTHEINGSNSEVLDQAAQTLGHEMHCKCGGFEFVLFCHHDAQLQRTDTNFPNQGIIFLPSAESGYIVVRSEPNR